MKVYCYLCHLYLGEIRDAKLKKEISYLCKDCVSIIKLKFTNTQTPSNVSDLFGGIFK